MRWRYLDNRDSREVELRAELLQRIDQWWETFTAKCQALDDLFSKRIEWNLSGWMEEHLGAISPHLMWEFGPAVHGSGHRLVITPESETHLRPMVQTLLQRAPKIAGWKFYPYRLVESVDMAVQAVQSRAQCDLRGTWVTAAVGQHNRIDLTYYWPTSVDNKKARNGAFVATETLLGEQIMDQWVGGIDVAPLPTPSAMGKLLGLGRKSSSRLLPLDRLKPLVDAMIASIAEQRPNQPLYALESISAAPSGEPIGAVFKLKPAIADDYPKWDDLYVASAADQNLWLALHARAPFYSARYSRHGEQFCYLKLDGSKGLDEEKFPDRTSIEDALDEILIPARAGCTIGGGTGRRYSYIDLALADVDAAIPLIRSRLQAGNIIERTWLLFFDAPLAHEWVGIYDHTPPPPGMDAQATM